MSNSANPTQTTLEKAREKFLDPGLSKDETTKPKELVSSSVEVHEENVSSEVQQEKESSSNEVKRAFVYHRNRDDEETADELKDPRLNKLVEIEMRKKSLGLTDIKYKYQDDTEVDGFGIEDEQLGLIEIATEKTPSIEPRVSNFVTVVDTEQFQFLERQQCRQCQKNKTREVIKSLEQDEVDSIRSYQSSKLLEPFTYISKLDTRPSTSTTTNAQETLVLYFHKMQPTQELLDLSLNGNVIYFKFRWNFLNFSDELVFEVTNLEPISMSIYKNYPFNINITCYKYLKNCLIPLELYMCYDSFERDTFIGRCDLCLSKGLTSIGKIFEAKLNVSNKELLFCYPNMVFVKFGHLTCRYSFVGMEETYNVCIPPPRAIKVIPKMEEKIPDTTPQQRKQSIKLDLNEFRSSDLEAFQEGLNLVLIRNKALRTTQEDISTELQERTTWMHQELKWKLTLQENAILRGTDPSSIKWRQWKDENTAKVKYRPICRSNRLESKTAVEITIVHFTFDPQCYYLMLDDKITHIFIDFNFLGYSGATMETETRFKPDEPIPIIFNYKKSFDINALEKDGKVLADMIKNQEKITFTLVSQPVESPTRNQSCMELAYCHVDLFELIQSRTDVVTKTYPFYDEFRPDQSFEVGRLKLNISGVLGMRSVALHVMAPDNFKVI